MAKRTKAKKTGQAAAPAIPSWHSEMMPVAKLKPADYNPRKITKAARDGLRASLQRWGLVQHVVWNKRTGNIVGGHQRFEQLCEAGYADIPCVIVDLPLEEEKALNIALNNKRIQGEFTESLAALTAELPELPKSLRLDSLLRDLKPREISTTTSTLKEKEAKPEGYSFLRAPFPWFGGKSRAAHLVWNRFGFVPNYVEPFAGSLAVLLARPHEPNKETVNDADCYVSNFWRAMQAAPADVAKWADWPVNEADLEARHMWLLAQEDFRERMKADPDYFDAKVAGWWVWGINSWIGSGFCLKPWKQLPRLGHGTGVNRAEGSTLEWFHSLQARLRRVVVACGDWSRVLSNTATVKNGLTGIFFDPPYQDEPRPRYVAKTDCAGDVRQWCLENGDNSELRIALCGYDNEHDALLEKDWHKIEWKSAGGYGNQGDNRARENASKERIWFSPHCYVVKAGSAEE